jgi:hypothetical protein
VRRIPAVILLLLFAPTTLLAQRSDSTAAGDTTRTFLDPGAAMLMQRAREARLTSDRSVRSYTAIVRSRVAAGLRMPLKDRTLYRQETAARVRWSRDSTSIVQLLAGREQHPGGVHVPQSGFGIDDLFDPSRDRMYFGLTKVERDGQRKRDDDFWIEHPLGAMAERHYRYQTGDTSTIRLQDGRIVRVIELRVIPRRNDPHTLRGMLWVDTQSGALVQAAFRLARTVDILRDMNALDDDDMKDVAKVPGFLKPFEFDISLMTVEYSLWEMRHWLPRSMRFEGFARAGVVRFPASAELSYQMLDVLTDEQAERLAEADAIDATLAEWNADDDHRVISRRSSGRHLRVLVPRDSARLLRSELLPPPVWAEAPGFMTEGELKELYDRVADVAGPARPTDLPVTFGWGPGEPDMVRYNRVEALSVGARVTVPLPYVELEGIARLGAGDLRPNIALRAVRETMHRNLELRGYHELMTVDESRAALGFGNSASALLLGRDEGEYYRAIGASLGVAPPSARRHWYDARAYVERQRAVSRNTHVALPRVWSDSVFRENIVADAATQFGALLHLRPWWGTDARRAQLGIDLLLQAEAGDFEHGRGRLTLRTAVPLTSKIRAGAEAAVGTSTGTVPAQRWFYLGGASTLRGYESSTVSGTSMARGRLELARTYSFGNLAVFSDWGWAGDRSDIRAVDQRWAVGAGASLLDGLWRIDLAHGLRAPRGWRLDMHLDAIL